MGIESMDQIVKHNGLSEQTDLLNITTEMPPERDIWCVRLDSLGLVNLYQFQY
jgi:hypothetical protein